MPSRTQGIDVVQPLQKPGYGGCLRAGSGEQFVLREASVEKRSQAVMELPDILPRQSVHAVGVGNVEGMLIGRHTD